LSVAWAWRPAVGASLARTLGSTMALLWLLEAVLETAQLRRPPRRGTETALDTLASNAGQSKEIESQASRSAERVAVVAHGSEKPLTVSLSYRRRSCPGAPSGQSRGGSKMTARPGFITLQRGFVALSWGVAASARVGVRQVKAVLPNPSVKPSPNSKTLGPRSSAVHHLYRGPSVSLLGPAYLER
jgi:hypothetical protein